MKIIPTSFGLAHDARQSSCDSFAVKAWDETVIAVMADGSGSSDAAREAAKRTVQSLVDNYQTRPRNWNPQKALSEFTRRINRTLHQDSLIRFGEPELVTTLSVAVVEGDRLYGLNVGDTRVYLARDGELKCLSCDHVVKNNGFTHVLEKAIGLSPDVDPYCFETELRDGDVALLCSDGVYNVLDAARIASKLHLRSGARSIVAEAKEQVTAETTDDLSVIVLDVQTTGKLRAEKALPLTIPGRLRKGEVFDGFTLVRCFQHSDRVWLAVKDGKRFTLKFAPIEALESDELTNLFIKEVWNATRLQNTEFFPRAFVPEGATYRYYAMEFIEAPSLKSLLRSRRLSVDESIELGKFLLRAAQYLLRFDLVHGDLKPDNILVAAGFDTLSFRLVDFGSVTDVFSVTSRAGTASYLAPERFQGTSISERTEIFSVGVTLFEALTRSFPFGEIERFQTPRFHRVKRPSGLNPNVPPWLEAVLLRATSSQPPRRYQNYSEMLFDLEHADQVAPYSAQDSPLIERDPLLFYKTGFYLLLTAVIALLLVLLNHR